jgi:pyrophosphatase PpaX
LTEQVWVTGSRGAPAGIGAVVFDFDDTLAETIHARIDAMGQTFARAGIDSISPEAFVHAQRGVPLQASLDGFDLGRGKQMGLLDIYREAYWSKEPGLIRLFDGVPELMRALASASMPIGILTSKARDIVVAGRRAGTLVELDELGLAHLGALTVGIEDVTRSKPHPEGLELLLGRMGAKAETTLVVGDSFADIQAAHAAGCWSCLAGWGVPEGERDLQRAMPDIVAEHPSALTRLLIPA